MKIRHYTPEIKECAFRMLIESVGDYPSTWLAIQAIATTQVLKEVACRFDELTIDTPRNRYVRAALEAISKVVKRKDLAHRC